MSPVTNDQLESADIQGLLARGFGNLPWASYVMVHIAEPSPARSLVREWANRVTPANASPLDTAMNVALTAQGVRALTAKSAVDLGFSEPYATGMVTEYRSRLLGDVGKNAPAGWEWGGPNSEPVHLAVLLYAASEARLSELQKSVIGSLATGGMRVAKLLGTAELTDREPFGFHDGISQPVIAEFASTSREGDVVKSGEFVLGYVNEYSQRTERPLLAPDSDPQRILPHDPDGSGAADLGRNGSYLVFRQLRQDIAAFEDFLTRSASVDGHVDAAAKERLAAKLVGRWRESGAPLTLSPDYDDLSYAKANRFGYHEQRSRRVEVSTGRTRATGQPTRLSPTESRHRGISTSQPAASTAASGSDLWARRNRALRRPTRPALSLPQRQYRPAVRVCSAQLGKRSKLRRDGRRRRPADRTARGHHAASSNPPSPSVVATPACPSSCRSAAVRTSFCPAFGRFATCRQLQ